MDQEEKIMTVVFRAALIVGAILTLLFVLQKIRKSEMKIADSTFWFIFSVALVIIAVFPPVLYFFSNMLGIQSPANFIFLVTVAILLLREFNSTLQISKLREQVSRLTQELALKDYKNKK